MPLTAASSSHASCLRTVPNAAAGQCTKRAGGVIPRSFKQPRSLHLPAPQPTLLLLYQAAGHGRCAGREQFLTQRLANVLQDKCRRRDGWGTTAGGQACTQVANRWLNSACPAANPSTPCWTHLVDQDALAVGVDARPPRSPRHLPVAVAGVRGNTSARAWYVQAVALQR